MWRVAAVLVAVVAGLAIAAQLVLPGIVEGEIEDRLTEDGGAASASVDALPALTLLFGHGDRLEIDAEGIDVDPVSDEIDIERLDDFDEVDLVLRRTQVGPIAIARCALTRPEGARNYDLRIEADTSPREVASFLGSEAGGLVGSVLGGLTARQLPDGGGRRVPIDITGVAKIDDGELDVVDADGSVDGVPAGALVELVLDAVASRL